MIILSKPLGVVFRLSRERPEWARYNSVEVARDMGIEIDPDYYSNSNVAVELLEAFENGLASYNVIGTRNKDGVGYSLKICPEWGKGTTEISYRRCRLVQRKRVKWDSVYMDADGMRYWDRRRFEAWQKYIRDKEIDTERKLMQARLRQERLTHRRSDSNI